MVKSGFRADIEGLRAIAIGVVLLCHAGLPFAKGGYIGVDVFFVISGFLITGLLVREIEKTGKISLREFYARRVRRLMPLAAVVLICVAIASWFVYSPVRNEIIAGDILTSALYVVNWRFSAQAVDYFAEGFAASPVQHFWSLAIEEQFYLVWPSLIIASTWLFIRRAGKAGADVNVRGVLAVVLTLLIAGSLAWSIIETPDSPESAYFATFTRIWELAAGGLLAVLATRQLAPWLANVLIIVGLAAIGAGTVLFGPGTLFPGYAALLPVAGTLALLWAGTGGLEVAATRVLTLRPFRYLGRVSYNAYLWHWPFLIFAAEIWGPLNVAQGIAVLAVSFIPVVFSHHYIEAPLHHSRILRVRPMRAAGLWAGTTAAVLVAVVALSIGQKTIPEALAGQDVAGIAALPMQDEPQATATALRPSPENANDDLGPWRHCQMRFEERDSPECMVAGDDNSAHTVVMLGDSHVDQWSAAFATIAEENDWQVFYMVKSGCGPADVETINESLGRLYDECFEWRQKMYDRIAEIGPDMVVVGTTSGYNPLDENGESMRTRDPERKEIMTVAFADVLKRLQQHADEVVVMADTPASVRAGVNVAECVAENPDDFSGCGFGVDDSVGSAPSHLVARFDVPGAERVPGVTVIDMTPKICPDGYCRAVIGDVIVFRDDTHITATIAESLWPAVAEKLPELK